MPLPREESSFERLSAKQRVYETVKDWIIEGQFQPGEKVSDIEIADYFKVSGLQVKGGTAASGGTEISSILPWQSHTCDRAGN